MKVEEKLALLQTSLIEMERVAVAFSGGVDSSFILKVAVDTLGEGAIALTAVSPSLAKSEKEDAEAVALHIGARLVWIDSYEVEDDRYLANTSQRCFFCKSEVYSQLVGYAQEYGFNYVLDGTNADDAGDLRPGRQAALKLGVRSPLLDLGFNKEEIRKLSRQMGLPNWDKPSAACLSSRVPYGTTIDLETLAQIEQAEAALRRLGFRQLRVRHHHSLARIEVEVQDLQRVLREREQIVVELRACGYVYVSLDLAGFRSGSMNEVLR